MKRLVIGCIRVYQCIFSPDTGYLRGLSSTPFNGCVFYPTCSQYMIDAVEKYGVFYGIWKGIKRVLRCHPWQKEHIDHP